MTVAELIAELQKMPQNMRVVTYDPQSCEYYVTKSADLENRRAVIDIERLVLP